MTFKGVVRGIVSCQTSTFFIWIAESSGNKVLSTVSALSSTNNEYANKTAKKDKIKPFISIFNYVSTRIDADKTENAASLFCFFEK